MRAALEADAAMPRSEVDRHDQRRDIERLLDHWFADGPTRSPIASVDVVADRIERQSSDPPGASLEAPR